MGKEMINVTYACSLDGEEILIKSELDDEPAEIMDCICGRPPTHSALMINIETIQDTDNIDSRSSGQENR